MDDVVSLCARRGFIWQSSEIYGGINGFWDYGPLGVELKNNLKALWWQRVVRERDDVEGIDSSIIAHPRTWEASGHVEHFSDPLVDCKACKKRMRADQLDDAGPCPARQGTSEHDWTEARNFNLMLKTFIGAQEDAAATAFLRAETCQSIFLDFKRVRESARQKIPFGIAQIGKAFRNEINPRNFTFRSREFEQAELEFFCHAERAREVVRALARRARRVPPRARLRRRRGCACARIAPTSSRTTRTRPRDIEFLFPFGWQEIEGVHDRGDWDLRRHSEFSGKDLAITDEETKERYLPMVIETSVGVDRTCLALLVQRLRRGEAARRRDAHACCGFRPRSRRSRSRCCRSRRSSPSRRSASRAICAATSNVFYDEAGNIGRRYRRQDEVGTPFCVTYDFESEADAKVTVRERDSMTQERIPVDGLRAYLQDRLEARAVSARKLDARGAARLLLRRRQGRRRREA